ncbi:hypothetical protein KIW84_056074 [Lathyrus oleraceus]|uniref:RNase H type-1 domain-containing protein n=1 Tax=Pisum sativum TaxID=3888 RepID=A0A9D4X1W1_PEA|nr:hypothetical protein KIW84_056074 [Pisum sativum]
MVSFCMFVLSKKLQILKRNIKAWTKNIFGNVHDQVKKVEKDLGCIQEKIEQDDYNDDLAVKEKETQVKLDLALKTKELFWKEKTIVQWPAEWGPKAVYFHALADRIKDKLAAWKSSFLFVTGRVLLFRILRTRVFKRGRHVKYHVFSSIWTRSKAYQEVVKNNSIWMVDNGENINLWGDNWCGQYLSDIIQIYGGNLEQLQATLKDIIHEDKMILPSRLIKLCPILPQLTASVFVNQQVDDKLIWKYTNNGYLTLKDAYNLCGRPINHAYGRNLWMITIPPSKSLLFRILVHDKFPTKDNIRGNFLNNGSVITSLEECMKITDDTHSSQCHVVVIAEVLNCAACIWNTRNQVRVNSSIRDFVLLKFFKVHLHPSYPKMVLEVLLSPLQHGWIKVNIYGAYGGMPLLVVCGGIFWNEFGDHLDNFGCNLEPVNALYVELMRRILIMEATINKKWTNMWLESDSSLVILAYRNSYVVLWRIRNIWVICLSKLHNFNFFASHIYN